MVSSLVGGQLLSRTGRYKILALAGFVVAAAGMFLLSRMDPQTTNVTLYRNMAITGLGIGVMISLFTIVVQNAFPYRQLGEVTATLTFFRTMGSTIGLAILGSLLTSVFTSNLQANIPPALLPYVSPSTLAQNIGQTQGATGGLPPGLQTLFNQVGPQEAQLLVQQLEKAIKLSLSQSITELFLIATAMMGLAFVVTFFLREIPLRRSHRPEQGGGAQVEAKTLEPAMVIAGSSLVGEPAVPTLPLQRAPTLGSKMPMNMAPLAQTGALPQAMPSAWTTVGATLAALVREAQRPDADPRLLNALSGAMDGRYPSDWTAEQRAHAVASEILAPLAQALLAAEDLRMK
jgi:MFS family permease